MSFFSVKTEDVELTCPVSWNARGNKETLECAVTIERLANPQPCAIMADIIQFQLETRAGTSTPCTVRNIDSVCDGIPNSDGCACVRKTEDKYILQYNITAVRTVYEGARWRCLPQCFEADAITRPLTESNSTSCFYTVFGELLLTLAAPSSSFIFVAMTLWP